MSASIISEIVEQLKGLPDDLQQEVLGFVRSLRASARRGIPGTQLLQFSRAIPMDDLKLMRQAIEASCEQVDLREW